MFTRRLNGLPGHPPGKRFSILWRSMIDMRSKNAAPCTSRVTRQETRAIAWFLFTLMCVFCSTDLELIRSILTKSGRSFAKSSDVTMRLWSPISHDTRHRSRVSQRLCVHYVHLPVSPMWIFPISLGVSLVFCSLRSQKTRKLWWSFGSSLGALWSSIYSMGNRIDSA